MRKRQKQKPDSAAADVLDDCLDNSSDTPEPELSAADQQRQAYIAAVKLLGPRDHSIFELTRKLQKRDHSPEAIQSALEELQELNYLNDARYAELYTEQRLGRGFGPLSVRSKLRERGIASHLVDTALSLQTLSWAELAQAALERRFDSQAICSRNKHDEARIARFLASRGFSPGDALRALKTAREVLR